MSTPAARRGYLTLVIGILKGGARKTTTAMLLAFELAKRGKSVLVIDADIGTQGVTDWATLVYAGGEELPFHVRQWAPALGLLVPFIQKTQRETGAEIVIVDIGGEAPDVLGQALAIADRVISPVGAERSEMRRVPATAAMVDGAGVRMQVLLTRVPSPRQGAAADARRHLVDQLKREVFVTETPLNTTVYSRIWGTVPDSVGAYEQLVDELELA
jgi:cellulose biosynthesis protein BcsQ